MTSSKPDNAIEKRGPLAFWAQPGGTTRIVYSIPLFHEIDFVVNEGYRKIPHGGIEVGGLLFGSIEANGTRVEAFRAIECEHASGPAFLLSNNDLDRLSAQLASSTTDPDLSGMRPIGWYLARTRGPLQLSDRELELFNRFFPELGQLTLLVKPERFQPTRFGFLPRSSRSAPVARDAAESAIILPLPGRASRSAAAGLAPSIPAPAVSSAAVRRLAEAEAEEAAHETKPSEPHPLPETPNFEAPNFEAPNFEAPNFIVTSASSNAQNAETAPAETDLDKRQSRRTKRLNLDQVRLPGELTEQEQSPASVPFPDGSMALVPLGGNKVGQFHDDTPDRYEQLARLAKSEPQKSSSSRLVMVLPLAALLGCVVGYIGYLQVPSPVIPLSVRALQQTVVVSWPPEETRNAFYAAVRVDDSSPVLLSPSEKAAGQVEVSATPDIKVELIARNWLRDSRGIVRYVKAANAPARASIP